MMFPAPASMAALNGGKYTFHSSASEMLDSS